MYKRIILAILPSMLLVILTACTAPPATPTPWLAGTSPEEIWESFVAAWPDLATQTAKTSATEISQNRATLTAISQNPLRATETMQSLEAESKSWSATQVSQIQLRLTEVSQNQD